MTGDMVSFNLKNNKIRKLRVQAENVTMKPKKKDYDYSFSQSGECTINFKNDYNGTVKK